MVTWISFIGNFHILTTPTAHQGIDVFVLSLIRYVLYVLCVCVSVCACSACVLRVRVGVFYSVLACYDIARRSSIIVYDLNILLML